MKRQMIRRTEKRYQRQPKKIVYRRYLDEIWKPIKGFEKLYSISNFGRLKSLERSGITINGIRHYRKEIIKKLFVGTQGYYKCTLYKDSKYSTVKIHILVWDHFGDSPRNGHELHVDHIDENKLNNHIDNLQLLTPRENTSKYYGTKKHTSKYTGVCLKKGINKFSSSISVKGKKKHLGYFKSEYRAHLAYHKAIKKYDIDNSENIPTIKSKPDDEML